MPLATPLGYHASCNNFAFITVRDRADCRAVCAIAISLSEQKLGQIGTD
jgi:hypothetical protein